MVVKSQEPKNVEQKTTKQETKPVAKTEPKLKTAEVEIKQKVLNLDTGDEVEISFKQNRYSINNDYKDVDIPAIQEEVAKLFPGPRAVIAALVDAATRKSYAENREAVLATGNFLTSELRSKIVGVMRGNQKFAELSAKDAFQRWLDGYKNKKPGALKILAYAQQSQEDFDL